MLSRFGVVVLVSMSCWGKLLVSAMFLLVSVVVCRKWWCDSFVGVLFGLFSVFMVVVMLGLGLCMVGFVVVCVRACRNRGG